MSNPRIEQCRRDLAAAQQRLDDEIAAEREAILADAITRGREVKVAYDAKTVAFTTAENAYNVARAELSSLGDAIDKHCAAKPMLTDFPSVDDVAKWECGLAELTAKRDAVGLKARELDAVLARARQEFLDASVALQYAERSVINLQNSGSTKNYV